MFAQLDVQVWRWLAVLVAVSYLVSGGSRVYVLLAPPGTRSREWMNRWFDVSTPIVFLGMATSIVILIAYVVDVVSP